MVTEAQNTRAESRLLDKMAIILQLLLSAIIALTLLVRLASVDGKLGTSSRSLVRIEDNTELSNDALIGEKQFLVREVQATMGPLVERGSVQYKTTAEGDQVLGYELIRMIDSVTVNSMSTKYNLGVVYQIVRHVGPDLFYQLASERNLSVEQMKGLVMARVARKKDEMELATGTP